MPPDDAVCRNCRYSLMGLADPRCPECGAGFDLSDERTMLFPDRLGPIDLLLSGAVGRRLLKPTGRLVRVVALLACVLALWASTGPNSQRYWGKIVFNRHDPAYAIGAFVDDARHIRFLFADLEPFDAIEVYFDFLLGWSRHPWLAVKAVQLTVVAVSYLLLRAALRTLVLWRTRQSLRRAWCDRRSWIALPLMACVTATIIAADIPFRLAFALSRSSLDDFVARHADIPPATVIAPQTVGVFRCGTFNYDDDPDVLDPALPGKIATLLSGARFRSSRSNNSEFDVIEYVARQRAALKATWRDPDGLLWIHVIGTSFESLDAFEMSHNDFPHWAFDGSGFVWSPDRPPPQTENRTFRRLTDDGWYAWTYEPH